jgi:hypothetical protein
MDQNLGIHLCTCPNTTGINYNRKGFIKIRSAKDWSIAQKGFTSKADTYLTTQTILRD